MCVTLQAITKDNYEAVAELYIPDEQQAHLSENIWSIAESQFHESHHARAICKDGQPVGFIMWVQVSTAKISIWRFMVAHEHQQKGIGRKALGLAIDEIKSFDKPQTIEICYSPGNTIAKKLYFSTGFTETGLSDCGNEAYAQISITDQ